MAAGVVRHEGVAESVLCLTGRLGISRLLKDVAVQVILPNLQLFADGTSLERSC